MSRTTQPYRAPAWLPGGHVQTIYPVLFVPRPSVAYRRERWDTPDGDFIDLDWVDQESAGSSQRSARSASPDSSPGTPSPLVVLFHGLEGSARSHYATALMAALRAAGWDGVVVHFRGCSGEPNRLRRAYHSGDSTEIDWILRRMRLLRGCAPLYAVGVSLGGNALLKWLGEQRNAAMPVLAAAAAVSAPVDLRAAGDELGVGFNIVYTRSFLATLKRKTLNKLGSFPDLCDRSLVVGARTLREFDNAVTAPVHGFRDTDDYWERASSKPLLGSIAVRTLMINACNDPFMPAQALPGPHEVSSAVSLEFPASGGHVGFASGRFPGNCSWLPSRLLDFFRAT